tara:strand:+ start:400 stop:669 length:270 start_codon:yes stop_codon:yes gene_type:complete
MNAIEIEKDEKEFEEYLNSAYGTVEICGMEFDAGTALKELDPIAFNVGLSDEPIRYQCEECEEIFDEEDEAEECCQPDEEDKEGKNEQG